MGKERPIPFKAAMVRAILGGQKTQTRRVVKPQPRGLFGGEAGQQVEWLKWERRYVWRDEAGELTAFRKCPYGGTGDHLWARETLTIDPGTMPMVYRADGSRVFRDGKPMYYPQDWPWQGSVLPSIFMPRWAARILLEVTGVRVERVQDILPSEILAEGIDNGKVYADDGIHFSVKSVAQLREEFQALWDGLNAKRGFGWETNPWVWVIKFSIHDGERPRYD